MTLNSKHRTEKIKTKNQRNRNVKTKTQRRRKPCFTKRIGRKCRPIQTRTEQNNDYTRIMHKIQFRCSFKRRIPGTKCFFVFYRTSWSLNEVMVIFSSVASVESLFNIENPTLPNVIYWKFLFGRSKFYTRLEVMRGKHIFCSFKALLWYCFVKTLLLIQSSRDVLKSAISC